MHASDYVGNTVSASASYVVTFGHACCTTRRLRRKRQHVPDQAALCDANRRNVSSSSITLHATSVTLTSTNAVGPLDDSGNSNADFDFRYDASLGGHVFNLKTTGLTTGTYNLNFTAGADPIAHSAPFAVK